MKLYYLEVVTSEVDATCVLYEGVHGVRFGEPDGMLGGARTVQLSDGSIIGVRAPLRDNEEPVVRPYWLVDDIEKAVSDVLGHGAEIAVPPMEIPSKGTFAIYILGGIDHGFWQL